MNCKTSKYFYVNVKKLRAQLRLQKKQKQKQKQKNKNVEVREPQATRLLRQSEFYCHFCVCVRMKKKNVYFVEVFWL